MEHPISWNHRLLGTPGCKATLVECQEALRHAWKPWEAWSGPGRPRGPWVSQGGLGDPGRPGGLGRPRSQRRRPQKRESRLGKSGFEPWKSESHRGVPRKPEPTPRGCPWVSKVGLGGPGMPGSLGSPGRPCGRVQMVLESPENCKGPWEAREDLGGGMPCGDHGPRAWRVRD